MPTSLARAITLIGAAAVAIGVWLAWIDEVAAAHIPIGRLIGSQMEREASSFLASIGLLLTGAALVAVLGALLPARIPTFVAAVVAAAVTSLLLIQEYNFLPNQLDGDVLGRGLWFAAAGTVALFVGSTGLHVDVQREVLHP